MSNWLRRRKTGLLLLVLGCAFVVLGIYRGEQDTVLKKLPSSAWNVSESDKADRWYE